MMLPALLQMRRASEQRAAPCAPLIRPHPVCAGSFINAVSTAPSFTTTTGVPNGIPGSGMCSNQRAEWQSTQGADIKQENPGSTPPRQDPRGALPSSLPGEQARDSVSTAAPSLAGAPLPRALSQVRSCTGPGGGDQQLLLQPRLAAAGLEGSALVSTVCFPCHVLNAGA